MTDFVKRMLSSKGDVSFSRCACAFVIYFKVIESLYIVSKTTVMVDLPVGWASLITLLYGSGKAIDGLVAVKTQGVTNADATA